MTRPAHILLGVCGGVSAYKAAELAREFQKAGAELHVIMTKAAEAFIQPLTFASLTGHSVFTSLWAEPDPTAYGSAAIEHIAQAQWADALVVAPATANTIARFCHGFADDFLSASYLATQAPVVLAPAMNVNMWNHPATQANVRTLRQRGNWIVEPESGYLACGMIGGGRLADIRTIVDATMHRLHPSLDLAGETILITAGGTREPIDPVRYLGNRSSGKMGYALATEAQRRGARVILISAATTLPLPAHCDLVSVTTADEMLRAVLERLPEATIVIKAAAVADFRLHKPATTKLERSGKLTLELESTDDIVLRVVEQCRPGTLVIAFAAEMGMDVERARAKLMRKGADAIVVNDISRRELGFDSDRNAVIFITRGQTGESREGSKDEVARFVLDDIYSLQQQRAAGRLAPLGQGF